MKNIEKNESARVRIVGAVGVALALALTMGVPAANADSNVTTTQNLTVGSRGQDVVTLQQTLSELGYLSIPTNIPMGYFGPLTKKALSDYQSAMNVWPSVGYYGAVSKVAVYTDYGARGWLRVLGWQS